MRNSKIQKIIYVVLIAALFFFLGFKKIENLDIGWHIKYGQEILAQNKILIPDTFSFTASGKNIAPAHWLFQVLVYFIFDSFGIAGLVFIRAFLTALAFTLLFLIILKRGTDYFLSFFLCTIAYILSASRFTLRPHLFTFCAFGVYYYILFVDRENLKRNLIFIPLIMLFWVNIHSGFIFGMILFVFFLFAKIPLFAARAEVNLPRLWKRTWFIFLATSITIFSSPVKFIHLPRLLKHITIYDRLRSLDLRPFIYNLDTGLLIFFIFGIVIIAINFKRLDFVKLLIVFVFFVLTLKAIRFRFLFLAVTLPLLGESLTIWKNQFIKLIRFPKFHYLKPLCIAFLIGMLTKGLSFADFGPGVNKKALPVDGLAFMQEAGLEGNVYNSNAFGGYIIWFGSDRFKVYSDGRLALFEAVFPITFKEALDRYDFSIVILSYPFIYLESGNIPLEKYLDKEVWSLIYFDDVCKIFLRKEPKYKRILNKFSYKYLWIEADKAIIKEENLDKAIEELTISIEEFGPSFIKYFNLGNLYLRKDIDEKAEKSYWDALEINSQVPGVWINLGALYVKEGRFDKAEHCIKYALKIKGTNFNPNLKKAAYLNLAQIYLQQKKLRKYLHYDRILKRLINCE